MYYHVIRSWLRASDHYITYLAFLFGFIFQDGTVLDCLQIEQSISPSIFSKLRCCLLPMPPILHAIPNILHI